MDCWGHSFIYPESLSPRCLVTPRVLGGLSPQLCWSENHRTRSIPRCQVIRAGPGKMVICHLAPLTYFTSSGPCTVLAQRSNGHNSGYPCLQGTYILAGETESKHKEYVNPYCVCLGVEQTGQDLCAEPR